MFAAAFLNLPVLLLWSARACTPSNARVAVLDFAHRWGLLCGKEKGERPMMVRAATTKTAAVTKKKAAPAAVQARTQVNSPSGSANRLDYLEGYLYGHPLSSVLCCCLTVVSTVYSGIDNTSTSISNVGRKTLGSLDFLKVSGVSVAFNPKAVWSKQNAACDMTSNVLVTSGRPPWWSRRASAPVEQADTVEK